MSRRRAALVIVIALACGAAAMAGAAATLGVTTNTIDSFAAAFPASTTTTAGGDTTAPLFQSAAYFDTGANPDGKIDQIVVTYNEPLGTFTGVPGNWTLTNAPSGMSASPATVGIVGSTVVLDWTVLSTAQNTSVSNLQLSLGGIPNTGVRDTAGNFAAAFATQPVGDKAAPALSTMLMNDVDVDGKVDQVVATFSESLVAFGPVSSGAAFTQWSLTAPPSSATLLLVNVPASSSTVTLTLTEGGGAADTSVGSFTLALTQSASGVRDSLGNQSRFGATAPSDKAAPVVTLVEYLDANTNGVLDQLRVTYTEALATGILTGTTWSITGGPTGMVSNDLNANTGVSATGNQVLLAYSETNAPATATTTVAATLKLSHLTNAATGVRDLATTPNLAVTFSNQATIDAAHPVLMDFADSDTSNDDGLFENGEWIEFTFSEAISTGSVPTSVTVTLTDTSGPTLDTLAISGILATTSLGGDKYLDVASGFPVTATYASSTVTFPSTNRIRVTLSTCSGTCNEMKKENGNVSITIANTVLGTDGLAVTGTVTKSSYKMF